MTRQIGPVRAAVAARRHHGRRGQPRDGPGVDREPLRRGAGGAWACSPRSTAASGPVPTDTSSPASAIPGWTRPASWRAARWSGIAEAAMHYATFLGRGFGVVTTLSPHARSGARPGRALRLRPALRVAAGLRGAGAGARRSRSAGAYAAILGECRDAVDDDGAEVIVLGCAGMADLAADFRRLGVPVVDGCRRRQAGRGAGDPRPADQRRRSSPRRRPRPTPVCWASSPSSQARPACSGRVPPMRGEQFLQGREMPCECDPAGVESVAGGWSM